MKRIFRLHNKSVILSLTLAAVMIITSVLIACNIHGVEPGKIEKVEAESAVYEAMNTSLGYYAPKKSGVTLGLDEFDRDSDITVLEVVPYKGMGQIGYLVGGCEPYRNYADILDKLDSMEDKRKYLSELYTQLKTLVNKSVSLYPDDGSIYAGVTPPSNKYVLGVNEMTSDVKSRGNWKFVKKDLVFSNNTSGEKYRLRKVAEGKGIYRREEVMNTEGNLVSYNFVEDTEKGNYEFVRKETSEVLSDLEEIKNNNEIVIIPSKIFKDPSYYYFAIKNDEWFKKYTLHLEEDELKDTKVQVITILPSELDNNLAILNDVDILYFSAGASTGAQNTANIAIYEHFCTLSDVRNYVAGNNTGYYTKVVGGMLDVTGFQFPVYKGVDDIKWSTAKAVFKKVRVQEDIGIVFNKGIWEPGVASCPRENVFKLYMMCHVIDASHFYTNKLEGNTDGHMDSTLPGNWNEFTLSAYADSSLSNSHHVYKNVYVMDGSENYGRNYITMNKGGSQFEVVKDYINGKYNLGRTDVSTADIMAYLTDYTKNKTPQVIFSDPRAIQVSDTEYRMNVYMDEYNPGDIDQIEFTIKDSAEYAENMELLFKISTATPPSSECTIAKNTFQSSIYDLRSAPNIVYQLSGDDCKLSIDKFNLSSNKGKFIRKFKCPMTYFNSHGSITYDITATKSVGGIVKSHTAQLIITQNKMFDLD